jgi:hypothetical protein
MGQGGQEKYPHKGLILHNFISGINYAIKKKRVLISKKV